MPSPQVESGDWRLLVDNHSSHVTIEFMWICWSNNVYVVYMPPYTSHVLQPPDIACFSPLKSRYKSAIEDLAIIDDCAPVKNNALSNSTTEQEESITAHNIRSGWSAAGFLLLDPRRVIRDSMVTTTTVETPTVP